MDSIPASLLEPEERIEGQLKVRGVARYAADAARPGMLWSAILYSSVAHARIVSLDVSARQIDARRSLRTNGGRFGHNVVGSAHQRLAAPGHRYRALHRRPRRRRRGREPDD